MKNLKAWLLAVAMALTAVGSTGITASAVTYDPCDVDRNGEVDILDVVHIGRYLAGVCHVPDYNRLDVNGSLTVDWVDYKWVLARTVDYTPKACYVYEDAVTNSSGEITQTTRNAVAFPGAGSSISLDGASKNMSSRTYLKYDCLKKKESSYSLSPASDTIDVTPGDLTKLVMGDDTRYEKFGAINTGLVNFGGATGFIIGDHQIATAAHCVYDNEKKTWKAPSSITTYGADGKTRSKTLTPVEVHVPKSYAESNKPLTEENKIYDYALITVKEDLSDHVHFDLGSSYNLDSDSFGDIPVYITGYAQYVKGIHNVDHDLYTGVGHVLSGKNGKDPLSLCFDVDASSGNSGSPVYTITYASMGEEKFYKYTALGIHSGSIGGFNVGPLITEYQLRFYGSNPNVNWTTN